MLIFVRLIFVAAIDYENIFTTKIFRFTVIAYSMPYFIMKIVMLLSFHYCYLIFTVVLSPQRMDMERATREAMDPNLRHKPRLLSEEELPSWLLKDEDEVGKSLHVEFFFQCIIRFHIATKVNAKIEKMTEKNDTIASTE